MAVLPYRTDALALSEWLSARARGRSAEQLREATDSPKNAEGTAAAAAALGFVDPADGRLTPPGERYALGDDPERRALLRQAMRAYAPYAELLRALAERVAPGGETEVRWIEAWWATRGFGSSESNRREGSAAFGRLADYAALGEYVAGRRGRPTRIRWSREIAGEVDGAGARTPSRARRAATASDAGGAPDLFTAAPAPEREESDAPRPRGSGLPRRHPASPSTASPARPPLLPRGEVAVNRITVPLAGEALAHIEVPLRLPLAEKRRLLDLLELLISEE